jgi:peptidoglycan/xylan/chitin deacetylase (PgdA/CDA1 family)
MIDYADDGPSDVLVLAYHAVSDHWDAVTTVTPGQLRQQMLYLLERGYRAVTFDCALSTPPNGRVMAVTFDDAHRSVFEIAFPMLRALGVVATVFAPTDHIGTGQPTGWEGFEHAAQGPHASELICMDWDQLRTVAAAGWEVGSHTCTHPHLTRLGPDALAEELIRSRREIEEQMQLPCRTVAYPYSDLNARVVAAAGAAGYAFGATIPVGSTLAVPLRWARVGVFRVDSFSRFRLLTSQATRGFVMTKTGARAAHAVRRVKGYARRARR